MPYLTNWWQYIQMANSSKSWDISLPYIRVENIGCLDLYILTSYLPTVRVMNETVRNGRTNGPFFPQSSTLKQLCDKLNSP